MEEVRYRATKLFDFSTLLQERNSPIAQCIIDTPKDTYLYILYKNSIITLNITNGKSFKLEYQDAFLPYITYDPTVEIPVPYICTEKGQLCRIFENEITIEPQIIGRNPFILYNNQIIVGDQKSGVITLFDINKQNEPMLKMNTSEKFSLNIFKIFNDCGILSLAANSKFIFALSKDRRISVFNIKDGKKLSSTTISGEEILSGTIKCDEENYYVVFGNKNDSKLICVHFSYDDDKFLYEIQHPLFNFIDINKDYLLIMRKNEITLHDKLNGELAESFLLPINNMNIFKNTSKSSKKAQNPNEIIKEYTPSFAYLSNNNVMYITTKTAIYRCRPILSIESYILNLKINEEWENQEQSKISKNILFSAIEFARTMRRENWIEFEENAKTTSDPTIFAYSIISQYLSRDYKEFDELSAIDLSDQLNGIIDTLRLEMTKYDKNGYMNEIKNEENKNPLSEFYRSACIEIIFAYSFFCRCIYFFVMFLTYKNKTAIYSRQLRELSLLVHDYTQLSLIAEIGDDLPIELFNLNDDTDIESIQQESDSNFNDVFIRTVMVLISKLLNFDKTMKILMNHEMYEKVIKITSICSSPFVYYGLSLLKLKRYDEAVSFFIQNSGFLADDKHLTESVFQILRSANRDDLIIRIGSINAVALLTPSSEEISEKDSTASSASNSAALFRAYIKEMDYDSAFNCILTTQNEVVKCDMLRVFISTMKKHKLRQRLLSYPFNTMISMFVNELWCYSEDTLILAVSFLREIGSRYHATQALYLVSRCLLRNPTRENLGKAITTLNLVLTQMQSNYEISVRDVPNNEEITHSKLCRIINRTHCCLLLDENSQSVSKAKDMSYTDLLGLAAERNNDVFKNALTSAHDTEIIEILPNLIKQNLILPLYETLSIKSESVNTCFLERTLRIYIKDGRVPPIFVIDKFIAKNAQKLLMICCISRFNYKKYVLYDIMLSLLHRKDKNKFFYLEPILRKLKLPEEYIEKFHQ